MGEISVAGRKPGVMRFGIALIQGLALYALYNRFRLHAWPASDGIVFVPLLLVSLFVPLIAVQAIGTMRRSTLLFWVVAATLIVAGLGAYDFWHGALSNGPAPGAADQPRPSVELLAALIAGLFVAHALISGGDTDRRWMASYTTHFDVAWKLGVQVALSLAFTAAFWALLWLGAGLFGAIGLDFLRRLIVKPEFAIPATALSIAAAIHLSDVKPSIVRGIRTLGLSLLSWLLPLMALIAIGFLAALLATGVQPLWNTRFAAGILLLAALSLIVLVNAVYQDGDPERLAPSPLRVAARAACLPLTPFALFAGIALMLRVGQYGWTAQRIYLAAAVTMIACYAVGYTIAALRPRFIERWNFISALVLLAILLALFTPVADPYRIAVADQLARLKNGTVPADRFDYASLRFDGGRFGLAALDKLKQSDAGPQAAEIKKRATAARDAKSRYASATAPGAFDAADRLIVHTPDGKLPESFNAADVLRNARCFQPSATEKCELWVRDVTGDGAADVLVLGQAGVTVLMLYQQVGTEWQSRGLWRLPYQCSALHDRLASDEFQTVAPSEPWPDLEIAGERFGFQPSGNASPRCPQ